MLDGQGNLKVDTTESFVGYPGSLIYRGMVISTTTTTISTGTTWTDLAGATLTFITIGGDLLVWGGGYPFDNDTADNMNAQMRIDLDSTSQSNLGQAYQNSVIEDIRGISGWAEFISVAAGSHTVKLQGYADTVDVAFGASARPLKLVVFEVVNETIAGDVSSLMRTSKLYEPDLTTEALNTDADGDIEVVTGPIRGVGSNYPDLGSTTDAEKIGSIYAGKGKDAYLDGDVTPIWSRSINFGYSSAGILEHWRQNADELSWTGWATYTGYVTPSSISRAHSELILDNSSAARAFYYLPYKNAETNLVAKCSGSIDYEIGVMVDDGVDAGDGYGANNFFRVFIESTIGGVVNAALAYEYRTGGGSVVKYSFYTLSHDNYHVPFLGYGVGTRWSSWGAYAYLKSRTTQTYVGASPTFSWTPARIGIYYRNKGGSGRSVNIDWLTY